MNNQDNKRVAQRGRDDELLTIREVADIVRVPIATVRYWRHLGTDPHSFRVGRGVRYWHNEVHLVAKPKRLPHRRMSPRQVSGMSKRCATTWV